MHGLTTRAGGPGTQPYDRVARRLGFERLVTPTQVHGAAVVEVDATTDAPRCDALLCRVPGVLVGVLGADCPGVLLVDPATRSLAVAHAGWRGVAAGVVSAAVSALASIEPSELLVWIGAGIGIERYQVTTDVIDAIAATMPEVDLQRAGIARPDVPGHARLSLTMAIRRQLERVGLDPANIECVDACTHDARSSDDEATFFSYRRDGATDGRHVLVAGWTRVVAR